MASRRSILSAAAGTSKVSKNNIKTISIAHDWIPVTETTTEAQVVSNIRVLQEAKSFKKLMKMLTDAKNFGILNFNITRDALRTLQKWNQTESSSEVFSLFLSNENATTQLVSQSSNSRFAVKYFCRIGNMSMVELIFDKINLILMPNNVTKSCVAWCQSHFQNAPEMQEFYFVYHTDLLLQATLGFASAKQFKKALNCLETMVHFNMQIDLESSRNILKLFTRESNSLQARNAIRLLLALGGIYDQDSLQIAVNAFAKNIDFIKGAVNMETLPNEKYGEVAFIGRSNVGKSSLINAITNRKKVAYTSKTPGKTSEFNYFLVSGSVGVVKEEPKFYLIDLPGVGYAQRSKTTRSAWTSFADEFVRERSTLRCIFHLIDSRHGIMEADDECFELLKRLPSHVQYVVVFTKVDKLRGMGSSSRENLPISGLMYENLQKTLLSVTSRNVPILYSSAETKVGALSVFHTALEAVSDLTMVDPSSDEES
jgi:GTP-binding protein